MSPTPRCLRAFAEATHTNPSLGVQHVLTGFRRPRRHEIGLPVGAAVRGDIHAGFRVVLRDGDRGPRPVGRERAWSRGRNPTSVPVGGACAGAAGGGTISGAAPSGPAGGAWSGAGGVRYAPTSPTRCAPPPTKPPGPAPPDASTSQKLLSLCVEMAPARTRATRC